MRSFRVLTFLALAAALSFGANGSPTTNAATDGFIKRQSKNELPTVIQSITSIVQQVGQSTDFTKAVVNQLATKNNDYNYIISAVSQEFKFDGKEGTDYDHYSITHGNVIYDVVVAGSGTYTRLGQGGSGNWAWNGVLASNQDLSSNVIHFVNPVGGSRQVGSS